MKKSGDHPQRISRETLEGAFKDLQRDVNREAPPVIVGAAYAASGIAAALIGLAYLFGRRAGRRRSAIVEVRRV